MRRARHKPKAAVSGPVNWEEIAVGFKPIDFNLEMMIGELKVETMNGLVYCERGNRH